MVDIKVGVVTPVQANQSRNGRHRQTLKKKNKKEKQNNNAGSRRRHQDSAWVTLSSRSDSRR